MGEEFKVELGVEVNESSAQAAKQKIRNIGKDTKVNIDVAVNDNGSVDKANSGIQQIEQSTKRASSSSKSFGDAIKRSLNIGSAAAIAAKSIHLIRDAYKSAIEAVKEYDSAIKDIRTVTNASYSESAKMLQQYNQMARTLGATTKDIADSAVTWLRQGKTGQEANTLIYDSMMLSKNGMIDSASAAQYLTSAMNGYKISAEDVVTIVDKLSKLDSSAAITAGGLSEAMAQTAVTASDAGVSMDKLLSYLTIVGEVTQKSMTSIGTSFRTIFTRMSDIKTGKLELIDEDGTSESLSDVETVLNNLDIKLRDSNNEFRNFGDVLDEVGRNWNAYSEVQQAAIAKAFAGTRQQENFRVLMANYENVSKYMELSANSAGAAEEKFTAYSDSIEAKTKTLQAAFESLSINTFSTDMVGGIIEASTALLQFLDNTNLLKGTLAGLSVAGAIKGFTMMATGITNAAKTLNEFNAALKLVKIGNIGTDEIQKLSVMTANLSQSQLQAVLASKALSTEQRLAILTSQGMSQAEAQAALSAMGLASAEETATATTFSLSGAFKGLFSTLLANPLFLVVAGVTAAVSAFSSYKQKVEEARQANIETGEAAIESGNNIYDAATKYLDASNAIKDGTISSNEFAEAQNTVLQALNLTGQGIDTLIGKYGDLETAILDVAKAETNVSSALAGAKSAEEEAVKELETVWGKYSGVHISAFKSNKEEKDAFKALTDAGFFTYSDVLGNDVILPRGTLVTDNDKATFEGMLENYRYLEEVMNFLSKDYANTQVFEDVAALYNQYKSVLELALESIDNSNTLIAKRLLMDSELKNNITDLQGYIELRNELISQLENDDRFEKNGTATASGIVDTLLSKSNAFRDYAIEYQNYLEGIENTAEKTLSLADKVKAIQDVFTKSDIGKITIGADHSNSNKIPVDEFNEWLDSLNDNQKEILYEITLKTDTAKWKLSDWQAALEDAQFSFDDLMAEEDTDSQKSFSNKVDEYVKKVTKLKEALADLENGDFSDSDIYELMKDFPELAGHSDNLSSAIKGLIKSLTGGEDALGNFSGIYGDFQDQFGRLTTDEDKAKLADFMDTVLQLGEVVGSTEFAINIDTEIDDMNNFYTAMKESVTSTGLTAESIKNLKERYKDLDNYNVSALFERTANGIHLNTKSLRELESEYENQKKTEIQEDLSILVDKYNDLTEKINNCTDAKEAADLYTQRQNILDRINDTADLAAQYDGLTSAFHKWEQAQSIGEEGDMYDSLTGGLENIKELYEQGLIGTNKFRTAVQLMSNVDLSTASVEELIAAYEKGYDKMTRYFQEGSDGCVNFLRDVQNLNSEWVHMNANGDWEINFGVGNDQEIADALGINVESVQAIMRKLSDYGFDINLDSIFDKLDLAISKAEKANDKLKELGKTDCTFNLSTTSIEAANDELLKAQKLYDSFRNNDGSLNVELEGATEAEEILTALLAHKHSLEEPAIMQVDTSALPEADADLANAIDLLQQFINLSNELEDGIAKGIDTKNTQSEIQNVATQLDALPDDVKTKLGLDSEDFSKAITNIKNEKNVVNIGVSVGQEDITTVQKTINGITGTDIEILTNSAVVKKELKEVDKYDIGDKSFTVGISNNPIGELNNINNYQIQDKHYTIYTTTVGEGDAQGTAYAKGDWGTKKDGIALGGEVGQELIVRDGKFFTIGEDSAELFTYRKGDIIFNAEQTRQILANGKITNGKKRGVSYAEGNAFSNGVGRIRGNGTVVVVPSDNGSSSGSSGSNSTPSGFSSSESKDSEKYIDRVEIKLDRLKRKIEDVATTINNTFAMWGKRNSGITSQISNITQEISTQEAAAERYLKEANKQIEKYGLDMDWVQDIQNGGIAFSYLTNLDELYEGYQEYQKWYEKYLDCKQQEKELTVELSQLYKDYFDNIQQNFENQIELNEYLRDENEKTYTASTEYFSEMRTIQQKNLSLLTGELTMLQTQLNKAVDSGAIEEGSEAWQEMQSAINDVKKSISETNVELAKLYTEQFEYIQSGYKNQMALYESLNDANEKNFTTNTNYFSEMRNIQKKNLSALTDELSDLEEQFATAMDSGKIEEGSEAWYEMQQAIDDVKREISSTKVELKQLYLDNFSYIEDGFKNQLSLYEHYSNIYSKKSTLLETQGYMSSRKLLSMQQDIQKKNISTMNEELATLEKELTRAMDTGKIEQYSSAWYDMTASINSVKEALYDANIEVEKLNKAMRQLDWDEFDLQQDMISQLNDESDFLINLMSYTDLYDKKGRLTDTGIATMGLHNLNADVYNNRLSQYSDNLKELEEQLADNPNNSDLLERKQELIKLQRESAIAMENEQKAIISMVENGIKIELNALKELIDTYKEALDSEKDLYDYQNQVADKSKDIATIQKQLSAYTNDNSEETRTIVQKLQVDLSKAQKDLQETEYSRSISDQKKLIDDLYDEYESFLNTRLDDTNRLLEDMRLVTNALPQEIGDVLRPVAESVSMSLSDDMNGIWDEAAAELKHWNEIHEAEQQITRDTLDAADASWGNFGTELRNSAISAYTDTKNDINDESEQIKTAVGANALGIEKIFGDLETREGQIVANNNANTQNVKDIINQKDNSANINKNFTTTNDALKSIEGHVEKIREESEKEAAFYFGDVDMDGKVTSADSLKVLRASVGLEKLDDVQMKLADVNGDGKVDSSDSLEILRRSVGLSQNVKSYSSGGLVDYTGIANVHGTEEEPEIVFNAKDSKNILSLRDEMRKANYINSPSQGMLIPIELNNGLFDISANESLWNKTNNPEQYIQDSLGLRDSISNVPVRSGDISSNVNINNENITLPNVKNYEDFVNTMMRDKRFASAIRSMTIDPITGQSELRKFNHRW